MLIIVIIVIVALVVGSVYAIFVLAEDSGITIYSVKSDLEREYHQRQAELIANCQYDILNYEGDIAAWDEMIAVYAVKLNLGDEPQEVATFDEDKAAELKAIFWDMNSISLRTESRTTTVTRYETNADGELVEVQEDVTMIILTVVTDSMSADEISDEYGFSAKMQMILDNLENEPFVTITYFVPDKRKAGGAYVDVSAIVERIDEYERCIVMTEGTKIPIEQIRAIEGELFSCYE